ncbi:hypothetical protein AB0M43_22210 [Longispora sp. NPDC051575]|uniref:hypothetical protein n=1 Tax=Longispora sp. NPDC051575 TaxID=3154943 RepID=UPI00342145D5
MAQRHDGGGQDPAAALAALISAYENAAKAFRAIPEPQVAFEYATELANTLRDLATSGAGLRAQAVKQIWDAEQLSLSGLAKRIGVSKQRVDQLLKTAEAEQEDSSE